MAQKLSRRRSLFALLVVLAAVGALSVRFLPAPADAEPDPRVDLAKAAADVEVPASDGAADRSAGGNVLRGRTALQMNLQMLQQGSREFEKVPDYTATFYKRERIGTVLEDEQVIELKLRHEPFSVYMKWLLGDKGRELVYVAGQNDGKMVVRAGGIKGRILPPLKLDPDGSIAMREARHPVTDVGLVNLAKRIAEYRRRDLAGQTGARCTMHEDKQIDGRPCDCFVIEYPDPQRSPTYRKSVIFIDEELRLPIYVETYGWPDGGADVDAARLDEATLLEQYGYSDIRPNQNLTDRDFDRTTLGHRRTQ